MIFESGDIYIGEISDNALKGYGEMSFANGDKYLGSFSKNVFEGQGKFISNSGRTVEGKFSNGVYIENNEKKVSGGTKLESINKIIVDNKFHDKKCFVRDENKIKFRSFTHHLTSFSKSSKISDNSQKVAKETEKTRRVSQIVRAQKQAEFCQKMCQITSQFKNTSKLKKSCTEEPSAQSRFCRSFHKKPTLGQSHEAQLFIFKKNYSDGDSIYSEESKRNKTYSAARGKSNNGSIYSQSSLSSNFSVGETDPQAEFKIEDDDDEVLFPSLRTIRPKFNFIKNKFRNDTFDGCSNLS